MAKSYQRKWLIGLLALMPFGFGCERVADISAVSEVSATATVNAKRKRTKVAKKRKRDQDNQVASEWTDGDR
jgi:hypothetical protein